MLVARPEEKRAIKVVRLLGDLLARDLVRAVLGEKAEKIARDLGAHAPAHRVQRRARPLGIALRQQRKVEQPLAGIVDDPDRQACGAARHLAQKSADRVGGREADFDADLADVGGALRPVRDVAGHLLDVAEIGKPRQPPPPGAVEIGGDQAALADHVEQRHAVGIVQRAEQIVDEAGDEDGLAGTAQSRHRQPDRRAAGEFAEVARPAARRPARRTAAASSCSPWASYRSTDRFLQRDVGAKPRFCKWLRRGRPRDGAS